jgi:hypothetical protein
MRSNGRFAVNGLLRTESEGTQRNMKILQFPVLRSHRLNFRAVKNFLHQEARTGRENQRL